MSWGGPGFVIAIIALSMGAWVINTWIRARHGYPLEDEWGGKTEKPDGQQNARLLSENHRLTDQVEKMQDRLVVLEKIVTDRGYNLAQEIEALRDPQQMREQGSGVPLARAERTPGQ